MHTMIQFSPAFVHSSALCRDSHPKVSESPGIEQGQLPFGKPVASFVPM